MDPAETVEIAVGGVCASFGSVAGLVKHSFSKQHLRAARFFTESCDRLEKEVTAPSEDQRAEHRAFATNTILSAVAFSDAFCVRMSIPSRR